MKRNGSYAALLMLVLMSLGACSGGKGMVSEALTADQHIPQSETPQAVETPESGSLQAFQGFAGLPEDAPRSSSAPPSDSDRLRLGDEWESGLSNHYVAAATFSPQFAGAAGRTFADDAAHAIYRFSNLAEYTGKAQIKLGWNKGGDTPQEVYIAVSNYQKGSWDWFRMPATMEFGLGSFAKYSSPAHNTYVVLASLDNGEFILDYIMAGTNITPVMELKANLDPDPLKNIAPLVVSFDATDSRSYGGSIVAFDYDWEGDGSWDVQGVTDGLGIHEFTPGNYQTTVRATDNMGLQSSAVISFTAIDPDNQPPTASFTRSPESGEGPLTVQFDASGSTDAMGGKIIKYEWDFAYGGGYEYVSETPEAEWTFTLAGANQVTLRVTDNYLATHTVTLPVTVTKGWRTHKILGNTNTRYRLAMCTSGSGTDARACIAFFRFNDDDLCFVRAINADASSWTGYTNPVSPALKTGYSPSMDVLPGGIPIIAYGQTGAGGYELYTVSADDIAASGWSTPSLVDSGNNLGLASSLRVINTIPCIAALDRGKPTGESSVLFFQANDSKGLSWKSPVVALPAQPGVDFESVTLGRASAGLFKDPVIAAGYRNGFEYKGTYISSAGNIDGTSWDLPAVLDTWTMHGNFVDVNGRPAYAGNEASVQDPGGSFVRALDGDGNAWPDQMTEYAASSIANVCLVVNGRPEIYYQDGPTSRLLKVRASNDDASAWSEPELVWNYMGEYECNLNGTVVNGKPVLAYTFWQGLNKEICSLSWY